LVVQQAINQEKELKNQRQDKWMMAIGGALAVALVFGLLLFRSNRTIRNSNEQLTVQKGIIEEKNDENELLLQEIHHRVKNNLQVISSLLKLHARSIDDPKAKDAIKDSTNRIQSIALMHKKLYQQDRFAGVEMNEFVGELVVDLTSIFPELNSRLKTDLDIPELYLDVETAMPLSLILNELIINALKYAYEDTQEPLLIVKIHALSNELTMEVQDNGIGLADGWDNKNSFGYKLVNALTRQLEGNLTVTNENGSHWSFRFERFRLAQTPTK